jgi:hypothetical protein
MNNNSPKIAFSERKCKSAARTESYKRDSDIRGRTAPAYHSMESLPTATSLSGRIEKALSIGEILNIYKRLQITDRRERRAIRGS